ncbi:MAG: polymer-forming cytoskeletal protein [Anaerolineae bacterium]|jgi:cytoskeletal protein CcmA (bactofilin family)
MTFFSSRRPPEEESAPRPALPASPIGFDTVIGSNCTIEGTLSSVGNVRIDGTFTGTLDITGNVLVGETARITADIDAKNISIAGAVRGNVTGNRVQLLRTGRIWGDINANALTTEEGAFIDGKITMKGHQANNPQPAANESQPTASEPEAAPLPPSDEANQSSADSPAKEESEA